MRECIEVILARNFAAPTILDSADDAPDCTCNATVGTPHNEACPVTHWARDQFRKSGENARGADDGESMRPVAIYQIATPNKWCEVWSDVSEETYNASQMMRKRIVYATRDAAPIDAVNARLAKFLDVAAGEGYVFDGIDAGELFLELFPDYFNSAASAPREAS